MLNRVTISALLKAVIMTLGVAVVVMLLSTAWESWKRLETAKEAEAAANAESQLFTGLYNLRIDRASTSGELNGDRMGLSPVLSQSRGAEMAALKSALEYLPQIDFPGQQALTAELADRVKRLSAVHDETAAALAQPKASRPAGLAERAVKEADELFGLIEKLSTQVTMAVKLHDAFIDQMMEIKQLAWTMRNMSGDATLVILTPMWGKPISPTAMNDYIADVSKYTVTWASLKEMANGLPLPARLTDAMAKVDSVFFAPDHVARRMKVLNAEIAGQPTGTDSDEWSKFSIAEQAPIQNTAIIALDAAKDRAAELHTSALWDLIVQLCLMACAIAGVSAMMWVVSSRVSNPMRQLSAAMRKLAGGDFDVVLPGLERKDEIGAMANAVEEFKVLTAEKAHQETEEAVRRQKAEAEVQAMTAAEQRKSAEAQAQAAQEQAKIVKLLADGLVKMSEGELGYRLGEGFTESYRQIKDDFNAMGTRLREAISGITSATREISNASGELSSSTTDLSQRTEEQAASLEETSASMEEISSTVRLNAENAQKASESASGAREVADRGGQVVAKAVEAMARIEDSSRKISDIIGVIDEIARQTNLLALNAAVEAARAGEAGRGFAVVASEVRSLAQRSSQAAKDIKDLITNSSSQVKDGVDLVNRAGTALHEIVDSIEQVVGIVSDIAAASTEQATGLEQVNRALNQMDEVTQQNSALVEENAATAKTLEQQVKAMDERLAMFRLEGGYDRLAREEAA
ncbi:MAG TPA: methyl-accepting chemotaxis protein [Xanthobacteraceae bacterium]|nr:methyl-accepting chemotaxis protein [Xanthobacteraceae bacterium]